MLLGLGTRRWISRTIESSTAEGPKLRKGKRLARVLSSKVLHQGPVFGVRRDRVIEPHGVEVTREIVTHPGSVVVLPVFRDGRILLIRQYRHVAEAYLWELVAGRKEEWETFTAGAQRELEEETGYRAGEFTQMMEIFPSPGFVGEKMAIFIAEDLTRGKANPEDDEKITRRIISLRDAEKWIQNGTIRDGKSVAGILFYSRFFAGRNPRMPPRVRGSS
jgi:ADP-ribose pyrophosphatase